MKVDELLLSIFCHVTATNICLSPSFGDRAPLQDCLKIDIDVCMITSVFQMYFTGFAELNSFEAAGTLLPSPHLSWTSFPYNCYCSVLKSSGLNLQSTSQSLGGRGACQKYTFTACSQRFRISTSEMGAGNVHFHKHSDVPPCRHLTQWKIVGSYLVIMIFLIMFLYNVLKFLYMLALRSSPKN